MGWLSITRWPLVFEVTRRKDGVIIVHDCLSEDAKKRYGERLFELVIPALICGEMHVKYRNDTENGLSEEEIIIVPTITELGEGEGEEIILETKEDGRVHLVRDMTSGEVDGIMGEDREFMQNFSKNKKTFPEYIDKEAMLRELERIARKERRDKLLLEKRLWYGVASVVPDQHWQCLPQEEESTLEWVRKKIEDEVADMTRDDVIRWYLTKLEERRKTQEEFWE